MVSYALSAEQDTLTNDWKKIELDLDTVVKEELVGITHPLCIVIFRSKGSEKQRVFVKHIIFE